MMRLNLIHNEVIRIYKMIMTLQICLTPGQRVIFLIKIIDVIFVIFKARYTLMYTYPYAYYQEDTVDRNLVSSFNKIFQYKKTPSQNL